MAWVNELTNFIDTANLFLTETKKDLPLSQFFDVVQSYTSAAEKLCNSLDVVEWKSLEGAERELAQCYIYKWSVDVLDVSIVHRDALLRYSKEIILNESNSEVSKTIAILPRVIGICQQAVQHNLRLIDEIKGGESGSSPKWFHQISPTAEIANQLNELSEQNVNIADAHRYVIEIAPSFRNYRDYLINYSNARLLKLRTLKDQLNEVIKMLNDVAKDKELTTEEITTTSKELKSKGEVIENEKVLQEKFEGFKSNGEFKKIPIYSDGGEMIYKEISFDKKMENWVENELFPKLYDADLDINSLYDNSIIALFNTRNKLENIVMNETESTHFNTDKISKNLLEQLESIETYINSLDVQINKINEKVSEEVQISKLYDRNAVFLPELNFGNIAKLANQQWYKRNIWQSWKEETTKAIKKWTTPFFKSIQQDSFTFVDERNVEEHNLDSNSLFLKKGYLGRSFYIQRKEKEDKILKAILRWRNGYQGSALLVGRRGSGKSSILHYIPQFIENFPIVQLELRNTIQLNGRKHTVTYDLGESINFLASQSINKPVIVCMDDLEKWQNEEFTMYDTIKQLTDGISKYGKRIFFLISTNHFMRDYINRLFDFDSRFSEIIVIDYMSSQLIVDALVVRHNASLKNVEIDKEVSLSKMAVNISSRSRNNIGASMMAWERFLEKGVKMGTPPSSFYKLIENHKLILRVILTHRKINESNLRKMLSSSDNYFISEELRKLKGYKIVQRTFDGYLKVNPFIVDEVEFVLLKENN